MQLIRQESLSFDENLAINEDALFVFQYLSSARRIGYVDETTYVYNTNRANVGTGKMKSQPLAFAESLECIYRKLYKDERINKSKLNNAYNRAYGTLGMRNLFHIVRCGKYLDIKDAVRAIAHDDQMQTALRTYRDLNMENLWIIPYFIRLKNTFLIITAFRFQLLCRRIKKERV